MRTNVQVHWLRGQQPKMTLDLSFAHVPHVNEYIRIGVQRLRVVEVEHTPVGAGVAESESTVVIWVK